MVIEFLDASVSYFGDDETLLPAALSDINLVIPTGQSVLVTGDSGCGKTTLLRCLNGLVPHFFDAHLTGNIVLDDTPVTQLTVRDLASRIGTVFQDPRSEFFTFDVASELAFCCENFAMPASEIVDRVSEIAAEVGITDLLDRRIAGLSGGEKQKLAIGSAMALHPEVLLFDEPSANLDLDGLDMLRGVIASLKERGRTTIIADHRLSYLDGVIDRCIVLEAGRVVADVTGDQLRQLPDAWFAEHGLRRLRQPEFRAAPPDPVTTAGPKLRDTRFAHPGCEPLWRIDELALPASGVIGITGANGIGKTTLMKVLLGLLKSRGWIGLGEKTWTRRQRTRDCALVMQDVEYQLVGESVWDEMLIGSPPGPASEARATELLARTGLLELRERHPLTLSGGQKQRLGIALACMKQAKVICLDEPTSGLDARNMHRVSGLLREVAGHGALVLVITHDVEFIESTFEHTVHIDGHQVVLKKLARNEE